MVEAGRSCWMGSGSIPLLKQSSWPSSRMGAPQHSWPTCATPTVPKYLLMFRCQMYCVLLCAHCLWSRHWEPVNKPGNLFHTFPPSISTHWWDPFWTFSFSGWIVPTFSEVSRKRDIPDSQQSSWSFTDCLLCLCFPEDPGTQHFRFGLISAK